MRRQEKIEKEINELMEEVKALALFPQAKKKIVALQ